MPFDIDLKPSFTTAVTALVPSGASHLEQTFSATFQALDLDAAGAFDLSTAAGTTAFLETVLLSADELVDGGRPVSYSPELRRRLLALPWARQALIEAYSRGVRKAAQGN